MSWMTPISAQIVSPCGTLKFGTPTPTENGIEVKVIYEINHDDDPVFFRTTISANNHTIQMNHTATMSSAPDYLVFFGATNRSVTFQKNNPTFSAGDIEGNNDIIINNLTHLPKGVLFYTLTTNHEVISGKLLKL